MWKILNVAKFKELGKGVVDIYKNIYIFKKGGEGAEILFSTWFCLLCPCWVPNKLWQSLVSLSSPVLALVFLWVTQGRARSYIQRAQRSVHGMSRVHPCSALRMGTSPGSEPVSDSPDPQPLCGCAVGVFLLNSEGVTAFIFRRQGRRALDPSRSWSTARLFPCALEERSCTKYHLQIFLDLAIDIFIFLCLEAATSM